MKTMDDERGLGAASSRGTLAVQGVCASSIHMKGSHELATMDMYREMKARWTSVKISMRGSSKSMESMESDSYPQT